jgi:type I restriction enzyme S subunit
VLAYGFHVATEQISHLLTIEPDGIGIRPYLNLYGSFSCLVYHYLLVHLLSFISIINNHLEQMAQAIFKSWFVDFEPFGGVVPEDWQTVPLDSFVAFQEGPGIRNWQYVVENGTRFINIRCIQDGDLRLDTANMISDEEANGKYHHFLLNEWDVVVSTSGTLGRYAIVRKEHLPLCLNTSVIRFAPKDSFEHFSYIFSYLTSQEFFNHLQTKASGSVQANFGPMHLRQIEMLVPPKSVLRDYHNMVFPLIENIVENRRLSQQLSTLRDTLLPRLISGELSVADVGGWQNAAPTNEAALDGRQDAAPTGDIGGRMVSAPTVESDIVGAAFCRPQTNEDTK